MSTWIGKGGGSGAPFLLEAAALRLCVGARGKWGPAPALYSGNHQKTFPSLSRRLAFLTGTSYGLVLTADTCLSCPWLCKSGTGYLPSQRQYK